jgi:hypothetical protein
MTRKILLLMILSLILAACGRNDADDPAVTGVEATPPDVVTEDVDQALFERIDADAIYVLANLQPMPDELADLFWEPMKAMGDFNRKVYGQMAEEAGSESPLAAALLREIGKIDSRAAWDARGLHTNGLWAVHSLGLFPVVHWQLSDVSAFEATLERLAADAGTELPRRKVGDEQIIWTSMGDAGLAIHYDDHFATLALVPDDDALLRRVANLDQADNAMDANSLARFNRARGFTPYGSGYLDFVTLLDRLFSDDDPFVSAAQDALGVSEWAEDSSCRTELKALTGLFPRFSGGVTRMDREAVSATMRLETEPGLATRLAQIARTPMSLDQGSARLLSAGLTLDLIAARDLAREFVAGWVDNPPECEMFANIRDNAADWQLALNRPIPPVVTNIQGFKLQLDSLAMEGAGNVTDASGMLAVHMRQPQMLIGMAQMFSPELAELNLQPGGDPQPLPPGLIPDMPELDTWIAISQGAIGLAVGERFRDRLGEALVAADPDSAVLGYSINMKGYGELMGKMMDQAMAGFDDMEDEMPPSDFLKVLGEYYEESHFSIHLTENGIEIISTVTLP